VKQRILGGHSEEKRGEKGSKKKGKSRKKSKKGVKMSNRAAGVRER